MALRATNGNEDSAHVGRAPSPAPDPRVRPTPSQGARRGSGDPPHTGAVFNGVPMGLRSKGFGPPKVMKMDTIEVMSKSGRWKRLLPLWSS